MFADRLEITLATAAIGDLLQMPLSDDAADNLTLPVEYRLTRTGRALRLIQGDRALAVGGDQDPALIKLLVRARDWWSKLATGDVNIDALSKTESVTASYVTRVVRLAFLAPEVIDAVLNGELKASISSKTLLNMGSVPALWSEQRDQFVVGG